MAFNPDLVDADDEVLVELPSRALRRGLTRGPRMLGLGEQL
ncbi:hypothetical protein [Rhodopila sp.]